MSDAALHTERLTKHFGDVVALDHLDLEVAQGEVVGYLGPNGAGKTTTMGLLLGLSRPTSRCDQSLGFVHLKHRCDEFPHATVK
jgi:ABC-2 type transport system ATP-binding protein